LLCPGVSLVKNESKTTQMHAPREPGVERKRKEQVEITNRKLSICEENEEGGEGIEYGYEGNVM
jgi:hypothetical protein